MDLGDADVLNGAEDLEGMLDVRLEVVVTAVSSEDQHETSHGRSRLHDDVVGVIDDATFRRCHDRCSSLLLTTGRV